MVEAGGGETGRRLLALLQPSLEAALRPDDADGPDELRAGLVPALERADAAAAAAALLRCFGRVPATAGGELRLAAE
ncbi:MAG: hypothetical protein U1E53_03525 [Dongiaceae bacterium]